MTRRHRFLSRFLVAGALAYTGLAIFFALDALYVPALSNALTAAIALIVARTIGSMERGGPSMLLASTFTAALICANVVIWTWLL